MKLIILSIVFCITMNSNAQFTFIKTYNNAAPSWSLPVIKSNDGGYLLSSYWDEIFISKTDSFGNLLWTNEFSMQGDAVVAQVIQTQNGGYAIAGGRDTSIVPPYSYNFFLLSTDSNGNLIWLKTYNEIGNEVVTGLIETPDSGFILTGGNNADAYIVRTDKNGDTLWTKMIPSFGNSTSTFIDSDYHFILASESGGTEIRLIEIDSSASVLWSYSYQVSDGQIMSVLKTSDNNLIATGCIECGSQLTDMFILKTDSIGQLTWFKKYFSSKREGGTAIVESSANSFTVTGYSSDSLDYGTFLMRINSTGDSIWTKEYPLNSGGESLLMEADGGFLISAEHAAHPNFYMSLIKTDSIGNTTCASRPFDITIMDSLIQGTSLSFTTTSSNIIVEAPFVTQNSINLNETLLCSDLGIHSKQNFSQTISISPNPFHTSASFEIKNLELEIKNCELKIFNSMGSLIRSEKILNLTSYILHRDGLSNGLYFYELRTNDSELLGTGKFIVE
jgi:hypothetical protein